MKNKVMKKYLMFVLVVGLVVVCGEGVLAQPSVSSVSGDVVHGDSITINGSEFGVKTIAAPVVWDTCESGSVSDTYEHPWPTGAGSTYNMHYENLPYRNVTAPHNHSNLKCAVGGHTDSGYNPFNANNGPNVGLGKDISATDTFYVTYYHRLDPLWPTNDLSGVNHKIFNPTTEGRWWTTGWYCGYGGRKPETETGNTVVFHSMFTCGSYYPGIEMNNPRTQWIRLEYLCDPDDKKIYTDNNLGLTETCEETFSYDFIGIGGYWRQKLTDRGYGNDDAFRYFDDIYIDNTWSRVVLTNNQNYDQATIIEPQIPSAWSDTSLTVTTNLGRLPDSGTAYLFVFDADNNHNAVGYSITLSLGQLTCPLGDADNSNSISIQELIAFIGEWKTGSATIQELIEAIGLWKSGC